MLPKYQSGWRLLPLVCIAVLCSSVSADNDADDLAEVIEDFNDAFGGVVDGELTPAQVARFDEMMTSAFDVGAIHKRQCGMAAYASMTVAANILMVEVNPAMAPLAEQLRSELVPGSLRDWLTHFSLSVLKALGAERTVTAASMLCQQKNYAYAMHWDLDMNSPEMEAAENCLLNQICD